MADYKRFISYMYIYKKGLKGNNIGYAKIESKNGTCKIILSVKYNNLKGNEWKIALFYRGEGDNKGDINMISIENISAKKDELTITYKTDEQNLFDSNIALNKIAGIILVGDNNEYIGTEWDDNGIEYKFITNEQKNDKEIAEKNENKIIEKEKTEQKIYDEHEINKSQIVNKENIDREQEKIIDNNKVVDNNDNKIVEESEIKIKKREIESREDNQKIDIMNFNKFNESRISKQIPEQKVREETGEQIKPYIKRILDGYPGMYPFEDDEVIDCIKLEPHDIGVFPMDKWPLANNSFLLHGYYTYRHLIFARLKRNNSIRYILGVPGIFRDRERFMAKMFGFNNFKGVRNKPLNTGEFGYWYMYLNV